MASYQAAFLALRAERRLSIGIGVVVVLLALLDLFLHYEKRHLEDDASAD
ncbi:hypothetical protein NLM33_14315 [Bradyrhizobium sp. CCGUVB1N3]|nr:hypothetical protein [Bradyrhizobium sp. CCGUVB1N3]MCP3471504.1 hypothetical protein [Bradyrhizobium sp. CCGUVB1N3]